MAATTPSPVVLRPLLRTTARPTVSATVRGTAPAPIALAALIGGHANAEAGSSAAAQAKATGAVVVQPGETLWSLAQQALPGSDPREAVRRIEELNHLTNGRVVAGQQLIVPLGS